MPKLWLSILVVCLIQIQWACKDQASQNDASLSDGSNTNDADPCSAAQPKWKEIWQVKLEKSNLEGTTPQTNLMDVWGSAPDNIYAVGFNGSILHFDGASWNKMESPTTADLQGVWGYTFLDDQGNITREEVFAVGSNGTIVRYDGNLWSLMLVVSDPDPYHPNPQPVTDNLHDVWGLPPASSAAEDPAYVIAVGAEGVIVRYDSDSTRFLEMRYHDATSDTYLRFSPERMGGVFGAGNVNSPFFVAVGNNGIILELSGDSWNRSQNFNPPSAVVTHLAGVWGRGRNEVFAVGIEGTILRRDNGGNWNILKKQNDKWIVKATYLRGYWGFSQTKCGEYPEQPDGGPIPEDAVREDTSWAIFVGWEGTLILGHDGIMCEFPIPTANRLESIWGHPPRPESERTIQGPDGGIEDIECDPVEVIITGVDGTILKLSNKEGR